MCDSESAVWGRGVGRQVTVLFSWWCLPVVSTEEVGGLSCEDLSTALHSSFPESEEEVGGSMLLCGQGGSVEEEAEVEEEGHVALPEELYQLRAKLDQHRSLNEELRHVSEAAERIQAKGSRQRW